MDVANGDVEHLCNTCAPTWGDLGAAAACDFVTVAVVLGVCGFVMTGTLALGGAAVSTLGVWFLEAITTVGAGEAGCASAGVFDSAGRCNGHNMWLQSISQDEIQMEQFKLHSRLHLN